MKKGLVYDLPTRIFHWSIAGLFVFAFVIAKLVDDESSVFAYHMLAGILLAFVVVLRIIWGFVGSRYARFSSFSLKPQDLISYLIGIVAGDRRKWVGHNPASSWAAIAMFVLAFGLGLTGYLMSTGNKEAYEDIHELLANGFLLVALMHIAGVLFHQFRFRDRIGFSMFKGVKQDVEPNEAISTAKPFSALAIGIVIVVFAKTMFSGYDSQNQVLNLFGSKMTLGENEGGENGDDGDKNEGRGGEDEDDD